MDREPLPDYSSTIRAQLEREVQGLRFAMEREGNYIDHYEWPLDDVVAQYVRVGYLNALHHGQSVINEGDMLGGLPVRIDRYNSRTISVGADNVCFARDYDADEDEPSEYETIYKNLVKQTTW